MNKKLLLPGVILGAVLLLLVGYLFFNQSNAQSDGDQQSVAPTPTPPETQLPPGERPIIRLTPNSQMTEVEIEITKLPDDVNTIDYELAYKTQGLNQGFIGIYKVSDGPVTRTLGSCSSGVCKYDKDITDMVLTIKYRSKGQRILLRERL